jgi:hypothetical protein
MSLEQVILSGIVQAEILRAGEEVESTTFFSSAGSPLQLGIMSHTAGFEEPAHYHPKIKRDECETQQFFIVTRGEIAVQFYDGFGEQFQEIILLVGDSILIKEGTHSIRVNANSRCVTVKQGPFVGAEFDKILVSTK